MAIFIKTFCFCTTGKTFESEKDDHVVNEGLQQLRSQGAKIEDITVKLEGRDVSLNLLYVIKYEAPSAL